MNPYLVADIGGTNARFALMTQSGMSNYRQLSCREFDSFEQILSAYLNTVETSYIDKAAIAIATDVSRDEVTMTNLPWSFRISDIAHSFGFDELKVLNDFAALAIAIPSIKNNQFTQVNDFQEQTHKKPKSAAIAIIGAGTGLGMSGLLEHQGVWMPLEGEGGHISLSAVSDFEHKIIQNLRKKFEHVSAETVLSGKGIQNLYSAISNIHNVTAKDLQPSEIVRLGIHQQDKTCELTLNTFCSFLGGTAGNLALTIGSHGGVYIGGGIVNHLGEYFIKNKTFMQRFQEKGAKKNLLKNIPIHVITDTRIGIQGAFESMKPQYQNIGVSCFNQNLVLQSQ